MGSGDYVAGEAPGEFERVRLNLLAHLLDPATRRRLETIGVPRDAVCLEVGPGTGTIVRWLQEKVGPGGRVVALDRDPRFLDPSDTLEIRRQDLLAGELEEGHYDLVHCRSLVMHLDRPEEGLRRMVRSLRSGGVLLAEEEDHGSFAPADPAHPAAERFAELSSRMLRGLSELVDPFLGRRLPRLCEEVGLQEVAHEGTTAVHRGGVTDGARSATMHLQVARPILVERGVLSGEECDELQRSLQDPSFAFVDMTLFGVWGKRGAQD